MQVFISWSGARSKAIAIELASWLSQTVQLIDAWVSTDMAKGSRWGPEITAKLQSSLIGIICVTPENVSAPWLLFEAGAISNTKGAHVCTLLAGLSPTDVPMPMAQFQATVMERGEIKRLLETINAKLDESNERSLSQTNLDAIFENNWPRLERALEAIMAVSQPLAPPRREPTEMLEEVLLILRDLERRSIALEPGLLSLGVPDPDTSLPIGARATAAFLARQGVGLPTDPEARRRALFKASLALGSAAIAGGGGGGA